MPWIAASDQRVAATILIPASQRARQLGNPERRSIFESVWNDLIKYGSRDTDVGNDDLAAQQAAGQEQVPETLAGEIQKCWPVGYCLLQGVGLV